MTAQPSLDTIGDISIFNCIISESLELEGTIVRHTDTHVLTGPTPIASLGSSSLISSFSMSTWPSDNLDNPAIRLDYGYSHTDPSP